MCDIPIPHRELLDWLVELADGESAPDTRYFSSEVTQLTQQDTYEKILCRMIKGDRVNSK